MRDDHMLWEDDGVNSETKLVLVPAITTPRPSASHIFTSFSKCRQYRIHVPSETRCFCGPHLIEAGNQSMNTAPNRELTHRTQVSSPLDSGSTTIFLRLFQCSIRFILLKESILNAPRPDLFLMPTMMNSFPEKRSVVFPSLPVLCSSAWNVLHTRLFLVAVDDVAKDFSSHGLFSASV
ncbi:hypothetical protein L218DRAFT_114464 [Marasmius fiardii PR-910]|nr:hypothetical protein L218DRAFT_114464 [Marasmius fiardii PR-910]